MNHESGKWVLPCSPSYSGSTVQFALQRRPHISPIFLKYIFSVLQTAAHSLIFGLHTRFVLYPDLSPPHSCFWLMPALIFFFPSQICHILWEIVTVPRAPIAPHTSSTVACIILYCNCLWFFFLPHDTSIQALGLSSFFFCKQCSAHDLLLECINQ